MEPGTFNSQLLTPERLRWVLDIGESTEAQWRAQKAIAFFQRGRVIRYTPAAAWEFITRHSVRARGVASSKFQVPSSELDWQRIERLIADQVRARVNAERGVRSAELKAA